MKKLSYKIQKKEARIAIIGLGYVGLPIALEFNKAGFVVFGIDTNKRRIKDLLNRKSYIVDISDRQIGEAINRKNFFVGTDYKVLKDIDIIIVCVPTPLRKTKIPNVSYIIKASRTISKYLKKGTLVVIESTTYPGTTRDVILPILSKSGLSLLHILSPLVQISRRIICGFKFYLRKRFESQSKPESIVILSVPDERGCPTVKVALNSIFLLNNPGSQKIIVAIIPALIDLSRPLFTKPIVPLSS